MINYVDLDQRHRLSGPSRMSGEMTGILTEAARTAGDPTLTRSVYFSPTAMTHIRRVIENGGTIITDTQLLAEGIDRIALLSHGVHVKCFINDPTVLQMAQQRGTTRAEIAADHAVAVPGPKLLVYGSAPAGIAQIMRLRQLEPLNEVCVLAGSTGFAGSVQLKERLTESDIASIVIRGKKGGLTMTQALLNAIIHKITLR